MLPPFIIEQIRKREDDEISERPQPVVELPVPLRKAPPQRGEDEEADRGIVIIDLMG